MNPIKKILSRIFNALDRTQMKLADASRKGANRRTIIILLVAGTCAAFLYLYVIQPPDQFPIDTLIEVPSGVSLSTIATTLKQNGVIRSAFAFRVIATIMGKAKDLHAGDYVFKEPTDIFSIARAIGVGAYGLEPIRIRIPEGATTKEMATIFGLRLERFGSDRFLAQAQPMEGYLFPDTYFFLPNVTEGTVIQTMQANFDAHVSTIASQVEASGHSLNDIVIMASILEREAGPCNGVSNCDRRRIAGVLWNRLEKGMALQVDATFLYTIGKSTFQLTLKDLASDSPYNTYVNKGLPPGAIGSPSLDSLLAAATPIKSSYLFYLADSSGMTHYSKTYQQHLSKKNLYLAN